MYTVEELKKRLETFGYEVKREDNASLSFCIEKVRSTVRNEVNMDKIPAGLEHIAVDMAAGEFLQSKMVFAPDDLESIDLSAAVTQIKEGDSTVSFAGQTQAQRMAAFVSYLLNCGKGQFSHYRRLRW